MNLETGKVRQYQPGDLLLGVYAEKPGFVGNHPVDKNEQEMMGTHALVSLMGQVDVAPDQVRMEEKTVYTQDGKRVGYQFSNGRVLLRIEE